MMTLSAGQTLGGTLLCVSLKQHILSMVWWADASFLPDRCDPSLQSSNALLQPKRFITLTYDPNHGLSHLQRSLPPLPLGGHAGLQ